MVGFSAKNIFMNSNKPELYNITAAAQRPAYDRRCEKFTLFPPTNFATLALKLSTKLLVSLCTKL